MLSQYGGTADNISKKVIFIYRASQKFCNMITVSFEMFYFEINYLMYRHNSSRQSLSHSSVSESIVTFIPISVFIDISLIFFQPFHEMIKAVGRSLLLDISYMTDHIVLPI